MITLVCPVCGKKFDRVPYEVKRNKKLGRTNVCGRKCHAVLMNKSEAKRESVSRRMRAGQSEAMNDVIHKNMAARAKARRRNKK